MDVYILSLPLDNVVVCCSSVAYYSIQIHLVWMDVIVIYVCK